MLVQIQSSDEVLLFGQAHEQIRLAKPDVKLSLEETETNREVDDVWRHPDSINLRLPIKTAEGACFIVQRISLATEKENCAIWAAEA